MIIFTQSNWMTFNGLLVRIEAPTTAMTHAVKFTVS